MDNSWDYNGGASEIRMGKALRWLSRQSIPDDENRRSLKQAARQLDESLQRLQVDCIDLVQHHEIIRYEDPHRVFDEEGANAALMKRGKLASSIHWLYGAQRPQIHLHMEVAAEQGSSLMRFSCR